ncbi:MAG: MepB family protein [Sphingobacteriales bacterium]|nr:MepB family protein [Sphingobacteriales bacterium]OJY89590.1 MAG: hypothetical protein BGP14_21965 [Sphingobacteriales bacterium 44-15]
MIEALSRVESAILNIKGLRISDILSDPECEEYSGCSFQLNKRNIKFRKAKITPKKTGQFVTLWKRNNKKQTEPYSLDDDFDFYMIATEQQQRFGFFLFPKYILGEKQILATNNREGKRGFRVYAGWDSVENKQAEKTKAWQAGYFIDATDIGNINREKFNSIIYGIPNLHA